MAELSKEERKDLKDKQFVFEDKRAFPIHDKTHARKALQMRGHKSEEKQEAIVREVCKKYPDLDFCKKRKKDKD